VVQLPNKVLMPVDKSSNSTSNSKVKINVSRTY
jgi:hypothetical protein